MSQPGMIDVEYRCGVCDGPVDVIPAQPEAIIKPRVCGHDGQKVIAWMKGSLVSKASMCADKAKQDKRMLDITCTASDGCYTFIVSEKELEAK